MKLSKYYEENVNLGNYQSARIGLTITSDEEVTKPEEVKALSAKILNLAKTLVREELDIIKKERGV